jgi:hypothetical protein
MGYSANFTCNSLVPDDAGESPADNLPFIAVSGVAVVTALFSAAAAALEVGAAL